MTYNVFGGTLNLTIYLAIYYVVKGDTGVDFLAVF